LEWLLRKLDQNLYMPLSTWLVSRELSEAAGPWDTRLSLDDDGEYFCRVLLASDGTRFVPHARALYRQAGHGSVSHLARSNRALESQVLSMQLHVSYLRSLDDDERVRRACCHLQRWMVYGTRSGSISFAASELAAVSGVGSSPATAVEVQLDQRSPGGRSQNRRGAGCHACGSSRRPRLGSHALRSGAAIARAPK
jgi:hypothetical protein